MKRTMVKTNKVQNIDGVFEIKLNNENPEENEFETEDSYINKKDYENLKEKVTKQLIDLVEYAEYEMRDAA